MRESFEISQLNYYAVVSVQFRQGAPDAARLVGIENLFFQVTKQRGMLVLVDFEGRLVHPVSSRSEIIDGAVARHCQQPWTQRASFGIESVHAVPHTQKSLLDQIFGYARIMNDAV